MDSRIHPDWDDDDQRLGTPSFPGKWMVGAIRSTPVLARYGGGKGANAGIYA